MFSYNETVPYAGNVTVQQSTFTEGATYTGGQVTAVDSDGQAVGTALSFVLVDGDTSASTFSPSETHRSAAHSERQSNYDTSGGFVGVDTYSSSGSYSSGASRSFTSEVDPGGVTTSESTRTAPTFTFPSGTATTTTTQAHASGATTTITHATTQYTTTTANGGTTTSQNATETLTTRTASTLTATITRVTGATSALPFVMRTVFEAPASGWDWHLTVPDWSLGFPPNLGSSFTKRSIDITTQSSACTEGAFQTFTVTFNTSTHSGTAWPTTSFVTTLTSLSVDTSRAFDGGWPMSNTTTENVTLLTTATTTANIFTGQGALGGPLTTTSSSTLAGVVTSTVSQRVLSRSVSTAQITINSGLTATTTATFHQTFWSTGGSTITYAPPAASTTTSSTQDNLVTTAASYTTSSSSTTDTDITTTSTATSFSTSAVNTTTTDDSTYTTTTVTESTSSSESTRSSFVFVGGFGGDGSPYSTTDSGSAGFGSTSQSFSGTTTADASVPYYTTYGDTIYSTDATGTSTTDATSTFTTTSTSEATDTFTTTESVDLGTTTTSTALTDSSTSASGTLYLDHGTTVIGGHLNVTFLSQFPSSLFVLGVPDVHVTALMLPAVPGFRDPAHVALSDSQLSQLSVSPFASFYYPFADSVRRYSYTSFDGGAGATVTSSYDSNHAPMFYTDPTTYSSGASFYTAVYSTSDSLLHVTSWKTTATRVRASTVDTTVSSTTGALTFVSAASNGRTCYEWETVAETWGTVDGGQYNGRAFSVAGGKPATSLEVPRFVLAPGVLNATLQDSVGTTATTTWLQSVSVDTRTHFGIGLPKSQETATLVIDKGATFLQAVAYDEHWDGNHIDGGGFLSGNANVTASSWRPIIELSKYPLM